MSRRIWTLTKLTLREAMRRKIVLAGLVLGILFLTVFDIGFYFIHRDIQQNPPMSLYFAEQPINFIVMAGLYAVNFLALAMSVLVSVDTLPGRSRPEQSNHWRPNPSGG